MLTREIGRRRRIPGSRVGPGGLPTSRWGLGAALAALLLLTGCAYFNTFYHARRFYADAEQIRETEARATTPRRRWRRRPEPGGQPGSRSLQEVDREVPEAHRELPGQPLGGRRVPPHGEGLLREGRLPERATRAGPLRRAVPRERASAGGDLLEGTHRVRATGLFLGGDHLERSPRELPEVQAGARPSSSISRRRWIGGR